MADLRCSITRWVDDEPQPGLVEARFVDAHGREWTLVDKAPMFTSTTLSAISNYPMPGWIRCKVVATDGDIAQIQTTWSDSVEGEERFAVSLADLADVD